MTVQLHAFLRHQGVVNKSKTTTNTDPKVRTQEIVLMPPHSIPWVIGNFKASVSLSAKLGLWELVFRLGVHSITPDMTPCAGRTYTQRSECHQASRMLRKSHQRGTQRWVGQKRPVPNHTGRSADGTGQTSANSVFSPGF